MQHSTLYYSAGGLAVCAVVSAVYIYWSNRSAKDYDRSEHLEKAMSALD